MEQVDVRKEREPNTRSGDPSNAHGVNSGRAADDVWAQVLELSEIKSLAAAETGSLQPGDEYFLVEARDGSWTAWAELLPRCGGPCRWVPVSLATRFRSRELAHRALQALRSRVTVLELSVTEHVDVPAAPAPPLPPEVHAPVGEPRNAADDRTLASCIEKFAPASSPRRRDYDVVHTLRTWPASFQDVLEGDKRVEVRVDDRPTGFTADDVLRLQEYLPEHLAIDERPAGYTGRELFAIVTHVTRADDLPGDALRGHVALSIELIQGARIYSSAAWEAHNG